MSEHEQPFGSGPGGEVRPVPAGAQEAADAYEAKYGDEIDPNKHGPSGEYRATGEFARDQARSELEDRNAVEKLGELAGQPGEDASAELREYVKSLNSEFGSYTYTQEDGDYFVYHHFVDLSNDRVLYFNYGGYGISLMDVETLTPAQADAKKDEIDSMPEISFNEEPGDNS